MQRMCQILTIANLMMKFLSKFLLISVISTFLAACQTENMVSKNEDYLSLGKLYGFDKQLVKGGDFWITTFQKIQDKSAPYVFYIEGDGLAFVNKYRISDNPTPRNQMLLKLAAVDKRPNVVYVARPCQYTPMNLNPKCDSSYWTRKRLSNDSVEAINDVINKVANSQKFSLVGFSGGGGVAVLVAARNRQVKDILTIAGNLDIKSFTDYHRVTPMVDSLNPIDFTEQTRMIPQWHISGGVDKVVPAFIADKFVQKASSSCVKQQIIPEASHNKGWEKVWEYIYTTPISCK